MRVCLLSSCGSVVVIADNKCDLPRQTSPSTSKDLGAKIGARVFQTSPLTNKGVEELFVHIARSLVTSASKAQRASLPGIVVGSAQE